MTSSYYRHCKRYKMFLLLLITIASTIRAENGTGTVDLIESVTDKAITTGVGNGSIAKSPKCKLTAVYRYIANNITHLLTVDKVSLIEYQLSFSNYSVSPLKGNTTTAYQLDKWSRVTTSHGQIILSLAFNYGVLSMATLTIGTRDLNVDLVDHPSGCMGSATEEEKIESIKYLLVRDFQDTQFPTLKDEARVCHEVILEDDGYALFRDRCYYRDPNTNEIAEDDNIENIWLTFLYVLLLIVRYTAMFFGPCLFISSVDRLYTKEHPYFVKPKVALKKTIFITRGIVAQNGDNSRSMARNMCVSSSESKEYNGEKVSITPKKNPKDKYLYNMLKNMPSENGNVQSPEFYKKGLTCHDEKKEICVDFEHLVDLSNLKGFPRLMSLLETKPGLLDKPIEVIFSKYHIKVDYRRLLMENKVDVGLFRTLYNAIFQCNLRKRGPFKQCCKSNMFYESKGDPEADKRNPEETGDTNKTYQEARNMTWIKFWRKMAKVSMIVLIPIPYYIRLIIYYLCEHEEVKSRKSFIERAGLREKYETTSSLMHYLTPTHPLFITIYVLYAVFAIVLGLLPKERKNRRLMKVIVGCFRDLETLSWTDTLNMVVSNIIWPFHRFRIRGCLVCLIYWPIALPVTLIMATIYSIPNLYLTLRVAFYTKIAIFERMRKQKVGKYKAGPKSDKSMRSYQVALLPKKLKKKKVPTATLR